VETAVTHRPPAAQTDAIAAVCSPCSEFLPQSWECRLLHRGGEWLRSIFENKRCRPREFIESLLRRRLPARLAAERLEHVRDIASEVVLDLMQRPPRGSMPSHDLLGLRRLLAGRAHQVQIDYMRRLEGRIRCGNCTHHRVAPDQTRKCTHPDPSHPWTGREVEASVDPRAMAPSCTRYASKRETVARILEGQDALAVMASPTELPDAEIGKRERAAVLLECLAAVQRNDPKAHLVVLQSYFRNRTNQEIADVLKTTVRTVTRYKERGLGMLRQELASRGIVGAMAFE